MSATALNHARTIERPTREAMLHRAPSVHMFWDQNRDTFAQAWAEWEAENPARGIDSSLFAPALRNAVEAAWADPTKETAVSDLWEEVFPGVYKAQFFDPDRIKTLRDYMDSVADADIPLRPPYGISLSRAGAMLAPRSEGYLAAPSFQALYGQMMDTYMRPISRLLFPDVMGYDTQTFGFSIQWTADTATSLRAHTAASAVTLNINLNLPGEGFAGSGVSFFDRASGQVSELSFDPGVALIHHGSVPHASQPITEGSRSNFVLWLYGNNGAIPPVGANARPAAPQDRWTTPEAQSDGFAPF